MKISAFLLMTLMSFYFIACSRSTEPSSESDWLSISGFPTNIYIGEFHGYTVIDQHYNISVTDSTDWQMIEIDSTGVKSRWTDIEYRFRLASSNPSKNPSFNFNLAKGSEVFLILTNKKGELLNTLVSEFMNQGLHIVLFNGYDLNEKRLEPDIYRAHLSIKVDNEEYLYSYGDFYLESEFKWSEIAQAAKDFAEMHFSREIHSEINDSFIDEIWSYCSPDSVATPFSVLLWEEYLLPELSNQTYYENIALINQNIFGWDDWEWRNNFEGNIEWYFEIIDGFKVWKGNKVTNPESEDFGTALSPYSENRERYIQLLNE